MDSRMNPSTMGRSRGVYSDRTNAKSSAEAELFKRENMERPIRIGRED